MNKPRELQTELARHLSRRWFLKQCSVGLGSMAMAELLGQNLVALAKPAGSDPLLPRKPHFEPKAKRVIYLFQAGAPSQLDLFDYKPMLVKFDGKPIPASVVKGQKYAFIKPDAAVFASPFKFNKHGQCGMELSEALPHLGTVADDIALIKTIATDAFNHAPAQLFMNTGTTQFGRPSMGAWVTYGLGSESRNLPAFVVLSSAGGTSGGAANWGCGFLPTIYQGVPFRRTGDPILCLTNPAGITDSMQRATLDALKEINEHRLESVGDPEIATRVNAFEMAFRMQASAPELMDFTRESKETLEMYGAEPGKNTFANNCLLARRLVERGVRFVQLFHEAWDHHTDILGGIKGQAGATDKPCAALIKDLKQRGLLKDTLVIWGGEFGRTPMVETRPESGQKLGRDHHASAFSMWVAGGGIKPGITVGQTDDFGFHPVEDRVHVHDLHATLLQLLGFDHTRLNFRFQGLDARLTSVFGEVVPKLIA